MHKKSIFKKIPIMFITLSIISALLAISCAKKTGVEGEYQTAKVTRGDLMVTVSSTGTLAPDDTVQVGTEVSGTIKNIYVDYNDKVRKGQVLARLKTDLLEATLHDAEANVSKCQAEDEEARTNYNQNKTLFDKGYLSEKEFLPYKTAVATTKASLTSAQAELDKAKTNMDYATIYSPIDGIVLARNIEAGQTVAASYSTPTLFVLAKDLTNLKIIALVDETDISQIKLDQEVTFTVTAYPEKIFTGKVKQIRPQSTTVSNVVNYTVIVSANNEEKLLLPGMTTTIEFIINNAEDALLVPNTALKFHPERKKGKDGRPPIPPHNGNALSANNAQQGPTGNMPPGGPDGEMPPMNQENGNSSESTVVKASVNSATSGHVWTLDSQGELKPVKVKIILVNESTTAVSSDELRKDEIIVTGYSTSRKSSKSKTTASAQKGGGRPGLMF